VSTGYLKVEETLLAIEILLKVSMRNTQHDTAKRIGLKGNGLCPARVCLYSVTKES
jgi:hypothetical protein